MLYNAIMKPHFEYGALIWHQNKETFLQKMLKIQKRTIRAIMNAPYNSHTTKHFADLKIVKCVDIFTIEAVKFVKNMELGNIPHIIAENFQKQDHRSRGAEHYGLKMTKSTLLNQIIKIWNENANDLFKYSTPKMTATKLKEKIFSTYVQDCNKQACYACRTK